MSGKKQFEFSDLSRQFTDANKVFYSGLIALADEIGKLPKDESTQRMRDALRLVTEGEKFRTEIAKEAIGKLSLEMQGQLLEMECVKQLGVAAKQQANAN